MRAEGMSLSCRSQLSSQLLSGICELVKHGWLSSHLPGVRVLPAGPYRVPVMEGRAGSSWADGSQVQWEAGVGASEWPRQSAHSPSLLFPAEGFQTVGWPSEAPGAHKETILGVGEEKEGCIHLRDPLDSLIPC